MRVSLRRTDYTARYPEALRVLSKWVAEGRIIRKYHIIEGLENAPDALSLLFTGDNTGKLFVQASLPLLAFTYRIIRVLRVSDAHVEV